MLRRVAIPESVTCKGLAPVSRTTLVTIVEANQRRFLKQSRTLFAYNLNKFPVDTIGVKEKRTLTSREESDIEVIVRQLIQHFEEFFKSKAVTPTESGVDDLVKKYSDIMMPIINSKSFYRFKGDLRYILPISMSVEGFEMRVRNAFIDPRPPLVRIFDAAPTFYGCATFLSAATCKSLEDRSQLLESEFATAPLVQTPLLQELKTWINGTGKKTLLVSGSSGSGKTTSVIGLGSKTSSLALRTAVLVSLPTDAGQFPGIASKQRKLDRAKAKQKCLQGMQDRKENSPEAHRSLNLKYLALGVEDALMNLQDAAASHLHSLPDNKTKESDLSETDETGASAAFGRALSDARLQAKREFAKTDNADIYTSKTILGCLRSAPEGVDCKPVEEAIFMLVTSLSAQIPSAVDTEQVLEQQKTVIAGLEEGRDQSVLSMLVGLIKRIAGEDVFREMGTLTGNEKMRLVVFLDEMGDHDEVVRALCSFTVANLEKAINKDKRDFVTLIAGGTGVGCGQHPFPDGSNANKYKVFYAEGGTANREIFRAPFGVASAYTFEEFKASLAIKIDDLFPAIDSNARLAFTLGRLAKDANDNIAVNRNDSRRQVAIDFKGMLQMAAIKWKSLNALESNRYAEVCEAITEVGIVPTDSDIFLSAAGISFLQFNSNRKRHYVQVTKLSK